MRRNRSELEHFLSLFLISISCGFLRRESKWSRNRSASAASFNFHYNNLQAQLRLYLFSVPLLLEKIGIFFNDMKIQDEVERTRKKGKSCILLPATLDHSAEPILKDIKNHHWRERGGKDTRNIEFAWAKWERMYQYVSHRLLRVVVES